MHVPEVNMIMIRTECMINNYSTYHFQLLYIILMNYSTSWEVTPY